MYVGVPMAFVRLFGCNLHCYHCDTPYALRGPFKEMSIHSIWEKVRSSQWICITGGEPLLQDPLLKDLVTLCFNHKKRVLIETSGSVRPLHLDQFYQIIWSVSPKLEYQAPDYRYNFHIRPTYLKFAVRSMKDLMDVIDMVRRMKALRAEKIPVYIQPDNRVRRYKKLCRELWTKLSGWGTDEFRFVPQIHYMIWGRRRAI